MKPFIFFKGKGDEEIIWRTASGRQTPIEWMTTRHIRNVLNCLYGAGDVRIPDPYFGRTHREWYRIFNHELEHRDNEN